MLTVSKTNLPGLSVPVGRLNHVERMFAQIRKSSQVDVKAELARVYEVLDGSVMLRKARNAEFDFRVMQDGEQLGWASRKGLDTLFFDMNGVSLCSLATDSLGPSILEPIGASRVMPIDVKALFKTQKQVSIVNSGDSNSRFEFRVVVDDNTHLGWGEREAFDFAFFDLTGRCLGRVPLSALSSISSSTPATKGKRSSSGIKNSSSLLIGRLKEGSRKGTPSSPSSPRGSNTPTISSSPLGRSGSAGVLKGQVSPVPIEPSASSSTEASGAKERKGSTRRLSEWQLKIRNVKPAEATTPSASPSAATSSKPKLRKDSVDYTPDGLSPELQDSGYDIKSSHKPMGLAGLLEPDDEK